MRLIDADALNVPHFHLATDKIKVLDMIDEAPTIDIDLADDGTLSVKVEDATKIKRVLVEDGKNGDLYYADQAQGEWIFRREFVEDTPFTGHRCSNCNYWQSMGAWNFCPNCGADMRKGSDDE